MRMNHLKLIALALALIATPASAAFLSVSGTLTGLASAEDGEVESNLETVGVGLGGTQPRAITPITVTGQEGDQTFVTHTAQATTELVALSGSSISSDNITGGQTEGRITANLSLTVDEEALYELIFVLTKDNSTSEAATVTFTDTSTGTTLFGFNGSVAPGDADLREEFTLTPGVTYSLAAVFESLAGGDDGSSGSTTDYTLNLEVVPEPGAGLVLLVGMAWVSRRRVRSA